MLSRSNLQGIYVAVRRQGVGGATKSVSGVRAPAQCQLPAQRARRQEWRDGRVRVPAAGKEPAGGTVIWAGKASRRVETAMYVSVDHMKAANKPGGSAG